MAACIAGSLANTGSAFATAGRSHPAQSRRCSAPAQNQERCGPPMSAACTVRTTVEKVGAAQSAMRRRPSIYAAWRWYDNCRLFPRGLIDDLHIAFGFHPRDGVLHLLEAVGRVGLPFRDLADDPERRAGAVGSGG